MQKISQNELLNMIPSFDDVKQNDPLYSKYISWEMIKKEELEQLQSVGEISAGELTMKEYPSAHNYWSPQAPIALAYYPYNGCEVYKYPNGGVYLVYEEASGHIPEMRCRLVQRELIVSA